MSTDDPAEKTRRLIDRLLSDPRQDAITPTAFMRSAHNHASSERWFFQWNVAIEHWWDLARSGVVAILGGESNITNYPTFTVTAFGRRVLAGDREISPHDRQGYLTMLRRNPAADSIALGYADEAVGAWQAGVSRASAVMLGCACERLVILMAEAVVEAKISPYAADLTRMLAPASKRGEPKPPAGISQIFAKVRGAVDVVTGGDDEFSRGVTAIFDHTRMLRNASGHPTGAEVSREEAHAGLLLFPTFYARTLTTIGRIKSYALSQPGTSEAP